MSRKWRPSPKCLYVIGEIHGNARGLEIILNRILPMRKHIGTQDDLILLGDYIDKGQDSDKVLDMLINVKEQYGNRVRILKGNHEHMLFRALCGTEGEFDYWIDNGGIPTISSYLRRANIDASPYSIRQARLQDIVPKDHIEFIENMEVIVEMDNYCFIHGGFDLKRGVHNTDMISILFDSTISRYVKECVNKGIQPVFTDAHTYVCAHNYGAKEPFVHSRYMALSGDPTSIYILELKSMKMERIGKDMGKMYKHEYKVY